MQRSGRPDVGPIKISYSISTGSLSPESKRLEEEAEQWPPSSVQVKKEWRYNLHSSVCHHTVHRELISRFTFMLFTYLIPGSIPGGVTGDFFRGSFRQNHVPWSRLTLWKWVPGISPGVKAADAYGWRPTTLVVPNVEMIWVLNLPGTPRATWACRRIPLLKHNN